MRNRGFHGSSIVIAGVLLAISACAYGTGGPRSAPRRAQDPDGAVWLNVTNYSNGPMEIYAAGRGTSYRIGTVLPGLTSHFVVRPTMIVNGPVEFGARADGRSPLYRSGPLLLVPGNVVDFQLTASPTSSTATVRP